MSFRCPPPLSHTHHLHLRRHHQPRRNHAGEQETPLPLPIPPPLKIPLCFGSVPVQLLVPYSHVPPFPTTPRPLEASTLSAGNYPAKKPADRRHGAESRRLDTVTQCGSQRPEAVASGARVTPRRMHATCSTDGHRGRAHPGASMQGEAMLSADAAEASTTGSSSRCHAVGGRTQPGEAVEAADIVTRNNICIDFSQHPGSQTENPVVLPEEPEEQIEVQQQEVTEAEEEVGEDLPECPDHRPSSFERDGHMYYGCCINCLYPAMGET